MAPVDTQNTRESNLLVSILSVPSHYFLTCHLLFTYLSNSSLTQFSLQRWFLKHWFETTSHNDKISHAVKHYNCAHPNFFSCRRERLILSTICSYQDQLLLFKLDNLWQVYFTEQISSRLGKWQVYFMLFLLRSFISKSTINVCKWYWELELLYWFHCSVCF